MTSNQLLATATIDELIHELMHRPHEGRCIVIGTSSPDPNKFQHSLIYIDWSGYMHTAYGIAHAITDEIREELKHSKVVEDDD